MKSRSSGCQRILDLLDDGEWHSSRELYRTSETVVHSRISELRKRGHLIEHRHQGGNGTAAHAYRLISSDAAGRVA